MTDIPLPDEDLEYLNANFPKRWRRVVEEGDSNRRGIIISDYKLPANIYTVKKSNLMIIIPIDYPTSMIDMFYFVPHLERKDAMQINALATEAYFDETWQRWSRHYTWEPGKHSIVSHISYVGNQLKHDHNK